MNAKIPITLEPANHVLLAAPGVTVAEAIIDAGLPFNMPCGGRGTCGGCAVKVVSGSLSPPDEVEQAKLLRAPSGIRLACRARVTEPVTIELRSLSSPDPPSRSVNPDPATLVLAVDLGTTSVKVAVASKIPGSAHAIAAVPNRQSRFGADVLTRVSAANQGKSAELQSDIQQSVSEALQSLAPGLSGLVEKIEKVVVVGNPVMMSLFRDEGPTPTTPDCRGQKSYFAPPASPSGLAISLDAFGIQAETLLIPGVAGHVGGDLLAGLLMLDPSPPQPLIYVDIGTNTEIAVYGSNRLHVASIPAGSAFEGGGISSGGHFGPGAVTGVRLHDGMIAVDVEGDGEPDRFCGSGLISLIGALRTSGHIDETGRMWTRGPLHNHFTEDHGQPVFSLTSSGTGPRLTQSDVRIFQTAKATVLAAIRTMLRVSEDSPVRIVVSGGFGGGLRAEDLRALGIIPSDMPQVDIMEDAALLGALQIAQIPEMTARLAALRCSAIHHELPRIDTFAAEYLSAMRLAPLTGS